MKKDIKIGVDLHGVIDKNIELFKIIAPILRQAGIKIYVISGPTSHQVIKELESMYVYSKVHYDGVYTIVNFLKAQQDVKMWKDEKNTWWASDEDWWGAKSKICQKIGIDIMIDNTDKYKPYFKNTGIKFILYEDMV